MANTKMQDRMNTVHNLNVWTCEGGFILWNGLSSWAELWSEDQQTLVNTFWCEPEDAPISQHFVGRHCVNLIERLY